MSTQCATCKGYFKAEEISAVDTPALCPDCLVAHIEKILYGRSARIERGWEEEALGRRDRAA